MLIGHSVLKFGCKGMSNKHDRKMVPSELNVYQIRLKGHLVDRWTGRFDGMSVTLTENGDTLLTGYVIDQAALFGLLRKVRDLGLPLLSVNPVTSSQADDTNVIQ